jgi:protein-S-isoprenylcysteine O-methyltransferase Ste14
VQKQIISLSVAVIVWAVALPLMAVQKVTGGLAPPWRPFFLVVAGAVLVVIGCRLVWAAAGQLAAAGISPFAAHPGPVLLTDGIYGRVRNPMDLGNLLMALGPAIAVDVTVVWIVPVAAFLYYAGAQEPLENYLLRQQYGEKFDDYKRRVPVWTPLWS